MGGGVLSSFGESFLGFGLVPEVTAIGMSQDYAWLGFPNRFAEIWRTEYHFWSTVMNSWILTFSSHTNYYKFSTWALKFLKTTPTSPVNAAGSILLPNISTASEDQPWWHQLCIPENFTAKRWRLLFYVNLREMEKIKSIKSTECIRGLRLCWCNAALGRAKFSDVRAMNQMNHWHCDLYTKVTYTPCSCPIKELTLTH